MNKKVFAFFTATVTSKLTVHKLRGSINGPADLPEKNTASIQGSTGKQYLREDHIPSIAYKNIEDAYQAMDNGTVEAIVYDSPVLRFYESKEGNGKVKTKGQVFQKESYAVALADNSKFEESINYALLQIRSSGIHDKLYSKWFGS
ncbi:MAG: transporter substrate-binding domain-containing protein [bacterium]|nr:transporter substrate-binding domain-containing protein [bacterium]